MLIGQDWKYYMMQKIQYFMDLGLVLIIEIVINEIFQT